MKEADVFYRKAKKLINFIENKEINKNNLRELITYLLEISLEAYNLPSVKPDAIDFNREVKRYTIKLDKNIQDHYSQIYNPLTDKECVGMSIKDDLDDITHDLEKGIVEYDDGKKKNAIFIWRDCYNSHFGDHIYNLLKVLHLIFAEDELLK